MVNFAESDAIRYNRLPLRMPIAEYVCGIQQIHMSEATNRTMLPVRFQDDSAKVLLMEALQYCARLVLSPWPGYRRGCYTRTRG